MDGAWSVVVPGDPPAINRTYHVVWVHGKPRLAKQSEVSTWQSAVALLVADARPPGWTPGERVRITVDWRTRRKRDCDAGLKALLDAVAHGLQCNDDIFLVTVRSNEVDRGDPRTVISIANEARHRDLE